MVPTTHLTKIFRQDNGSVISKLAKCVVEGSMPPLKYLNPVNKEVEFIALADPQKIHRKVLELLLKSEDVSNRGVPKTMILIPTKKNEVGTVAMNATIHRYIFKEDQNVTGQLKFKPSERIICTVNSYAKDDEGEVIPEMSVFNGECGVFDWYVDKGNVEVTIYQPNNKENPFKTVKVDKDVIEMGWTCTVHKQQGSEYDTVIMVLHDSHSIMLNREVFYTGITRAKKKLYIVGTEQCIARCVRHTAPKRYDCFQEMLAETFETMPRDGDL